MRFLSNHFHVCAFFDVFDFYVFISLILQLFKTEFFHGI